MTRLEDRLAISEVLVRYATGIDTRDWDLFRSVFTPDVSADYGSIGAWEGVEGITESMIAWQANLSHSMHQVTNVAVEFDDTAPDQPDHARSTAYVSVLLMNAEGTRGTTAHGTYADVWVRGESGWRIQQRRFTLVQLGAVENLDRG